MNEDAELVADLVRAGVDPDLIGRVAAALARREPVIIEVERPRSVNAERQARYRERNKALQGVTNRNVVTLPDKEIPPTPPKEINPPSPKENPPKGGQKKRGSRIPDDFQPDIEFALSQGLTATQARAEAAKFRDWAAGAPGQKGVKQDWPATWRNWARRAAGDLGCVPPASTDPPVGMNGRVVVRNTDPEWSRLRSRYRDETGKLLNVELWAFPEEWVKEIST